MSRKWRDAEPRWRWMTELSCDPTVDVYAYRVAGALFAGMDRHTGETTSGTALLIAQTGLQERTVRLARRRLEELGWIEREPGKGGRGRRAVTRLRFPSDADPLPFQAPAATPPADVFEQMRRVVGGTKTPSFNARV